jgi:hypothetical protein
LRCHLVEYGLLSLAFYTRFPQRCAGIDRSVAFIHKNSLDAETAFQTPGEAPAPLCQFMLSTVSVQGQAYHQQGRLPFTDQLENTFELPFPVATAYRRKRMRQTQPQVAYRNANASLAKIER